MTRITNRAMHAAAIIAAAALTACTADDNNNISNTPADAVTITTLVHKTVQNNPEPSARAFAPITRADATAAPYALEGATLTLLYGTMNATADATATYTCNADGAWNTTAPLYWNDLQANDAAAYPFFAASPAVPADQPVVPADQSTPAAYTSADQLVAYTTTTERRINVPITLHHVLSQITVKLVSGTDEEGTPDIPATAIAGATLQIDGAKAAYTMAYAADATAPATATAKADAAAAAITPLRAAAAAATTKFHAIVPPQTIAVDALKLTFTIDGETYTWTNPEEISIEAAVNHLISITAKKSKMLLGTVDIVPWTETATIDDEVKLDDITNGGEINLPATAGTFYLAHIADANTRTTAIYSWTPGTTTPGTLTLTDASAPIKWNKLDKTTKHTFGATFSPTAAPTNGHEKDYLTATATDVAFGAALNFSQMPHANAQLSVKLASDGKTYTPEELKTATVKATVSQASVCSADGVISFTDITKKEVTLLRNTEATDPAEANTHTAILAPQTLEYAEAPAAPVVSIVITIDQKTYSIKQSVVLEAGKHTVLTANIKASEVGITVGSAGWDTGADVDGGDIEIDK